jgi:L-cystine uptake protein TcyP (sodium:dicarboxylate symporter family)
MIPISPIGAGVAVSASTTSASSALTIPATPETAIRAVNASASIAYVRVTVGASTAVNTDTAIAPNSETIIRVGNSKGFTHVAALLASGTGIVHFQPVVVD